jgi:uncharacterized protein (UPF0264 family)
VHDTALSETNERGCAGALDAPRLLVSVRNPAESEAALAGGCDVLDIKEPVRGALGMADLPTIVAIVARVGARHSPVPVSVALGEVGEREGIQRVLRLPPQIAYLKLGTAGLGTDAGWARRFGKVTDRFARDEREAANGGTCDSVKWVAVAYADWVIARGPCPEEVIEGARECACAGVLIDTFSKKNGRLFDWLSVERLKSLAVLARRHGLKFALAGRLQIGDLPRLTLVGPDIVGIRSAACRAGIRTAQIDASAVRTFREALHASRQAVAPASRPIHPGGVRVAQRG